jgi:NADPH2:quinone reductase
VPLPESIETQTAAAMMLKGMTARYLVRETYPVAQGDTVLIHAAAGGVGTILCQWASMLGAEVIGTVGSSGKVQHANTNGCAHPIVYTREDFVTRCGEITGGAGVTVVYDSVGKDTFLRSLDCLRPRGMLVSYGQSSGAIGAFDPLVLSQKGSLYLTRPTLATYVAKREALLANSRDLFGQVERGVVRIEIGQTYPLSEAARAHEDLEARKTTASTVLIP